MHGFRLALQAAVAEASGSVVCLKKAKQFCGWLERSSRPTYVLVSDWREAKPCRDVLETLPKACHPTNMVVYVDHAKQFEKAVQWVQALPKGGCPTSAREIDLADAAEPRRLVQDLLTHMQPPPAPAGGIGGARRSAAPAPAHPAVAVAVAPPVPPAVVHSAPAAMPAPPAGVPVVPVPATPGPAPASTSFVRPPPAGQWAPPQCPMPLQQPASANVLPPPPPLATVLQRLLHLRQLHTARPPPPPHWQPRVGQPAPGSGQWNVEEEGRVFAHSERHRQPPPGAFGGLQLVPIPDPRTNHSDEEMHADCDLHGPSSPGAPRVQYQADEAQDAGEGDGYDERGGPRHLRWSVLAPPVARVIASACGPTSDPDVIINMLAVAEPGYYEE